MKTKLKFEAFPEFVGKPMSELNEYLQKNYAGQLAREEDLTEENIPKDGNWYYAFGSVRHQDGYASTTPCLYWNGESLIRLADWLDNEWNEADRVLLLETIEKVEKEFEIEVDDVIHNLEALDFNSEEARNVVRKALSSERQRLRKLISNWEIDKESHSKGKCSFSILAICSAEEQKIKRDLLKLLE